MKSTNRRSVAAVLLASLGASTAVSLGAGPAAGAGRIPGEYGTLWVTNRTLNNVAAIDAGTGQVVGTVAVGGSPIGIVAPLGTGKVYSSDEASNQVTVISRATRTVLKTIPVGAKPHHMAASVLGDRVYVAEFGQRTIAVIDTATDTKIASLVASPDPGARTHAVWPSRDGRRLYATNEVTSDIAAIDVATGQLLWNLPVGNRPSEILVDVDGLRAWVSVRNENKVKEVDLTIPRLTGREVTVGVQPDTLQLTPDRSTLVVALRGTPAQVSLVRTQTPDLQVTTVTVPGSVAGHQWLSRSGRYTFMATEGAEGVAGVAVVDNTTATPVGRYPYPGGGRPHGLFYDPLPPWYSG